MKTSMSFKKNGFFFVVGFFSIFCHARTLHFGFFPNVTHVHALVAQNFQREGRGWFEAFLPKNTDIEWHRFNAGPSAMEGILTHSLDVTYVGPSPALNLYTRSKGLEIRLLAGAIKGGSGLVVQNDLSIKTSEDWQGKRIASPQFGNTQDVACRFWFVQKGLSIGFSSTAVKVTPTANPDQLMLFRKKLVDAVWTIEPWISRLMNEGNGVLYEEDKDNWTTILVASQSFTKEEPECAKKLIEAHCALTEWIKQHPEEACKRVQAELKAQIHLEFPLPLIESSLKRLNLENVVSKESLESWLEAAQSIGFLKKIVRLDDFFEFIKKTP